MSIQQENMVDYLFNHLMDDQLLSSDETDQLERNFISMLPACMKDETDIGTLKHQYAEAYIALMDATQRDAFLAGLRVGRDLAKT